MKLARERAVQVKYILPLNDSSESREIEREMRQRRLSFAAVATQARPVPSIDTGCGAYEGAAEIRSCTILNPKWEHKRTKIKNMPLRAKSRL